MEPDWDVATALILEFEGFRPWPYDDAHPSSRWFPGAEIEGTLTIGYGETRADIVQSYVRSGGEITKEEAFDLFQERVPSYWNATLRYFVDDLNPNQYAAITSVAYNAGPAGMKTWAPKLVTAINEHRWDDVRALWPESIINLGTKFEAGLRRRRRREVEVFFEPYSPTIVPPDSWADMFVVLLAS